MLGIVAVQIDLNPDYTTSLAGHKQSHFQKDSRLLSVCLSGGLLRDSLHKVSHVTHGCFPLLKGKKNLFFRKLSAKELMLLNCGVREDS